MSRKAPWLRPDRGIYPLSEFARRGAASFGDHPALQVREGEGFRRISYTEFRDRVHGVARWLGDQGVRPGDKVAVLGSNRPQWAIAHYGGLTAGAIMVPVDNALPDNGVRHILADSGAVALFADESRLEQLETAAPLKSLRHRISLDQALPGEQTLSLEQVIEQGCRSGTGLPEVALDDTAAIFYTSGTTGHAKGVMLSHRNVVKDLALASQALPFGPGHHFLSVLPLHHTYENTLGLGAPLYNGCSITYARSLKSRDLLADLRGAQITIMLTVPLLLEKLQEGIERAVREKGLATRTLFRAMMGIARIGESLGLRPGVALFRSVREKAGLGTMKYLISGGGPLAASTSRFFNLLGIWTLQGYGLTETSPMTHYSYPRPGGVTHGSVGIPYPEIEVKLVDRDENGVGEVCIRGPIVFQGYYKKPEATAEVMDEEGFFHTGDLGWEDEQQWLRITGRRKNLIVTGGGKNIYPEEIEAGLNDSPYIAEALVLGVPRQRGAGEEVAALVYPDYEQVDLLFEKGGSTPEEKDLLKRIYAELSKLEKGIRRELQKVGVSLGELPEEVQHASEADIGELIRLELRRLQKGQPDYKRIKLFRITPEEFAKTSTRKIKRYLYSGDLVAVNGKKV